MTLDQLDTDFSELIFELPEKIYSTAQLLYLRECPNWTLDFGKYTSKISS